MVLPAVLRQVFEHSSVPKKQWLGCNIVSGGTATSMTSCTARQISASSLLCDRTATCFSTKPQVPSLHGNLADNTRLLKFGTMHRRQQACSSGLGFVLKC